MLQAAMQRRTAMETVAGGGGEGDGDAFDMELGLGGLSVTEGPGAGPLTAGALVGAVPVQTTSGPFSVSSV